MAMPDKIGGPEEDKKPGLVIAFGMKKPKGMPDKIGGSDDEEEPEGGDEHISNDQAMDDATDELISALKELKPSRNRVKAALRAFFYACDAEPHEEGEHDEEEGSED